VGAAAAVDAYLHAHKDEFPIRSSNIQDQAYQVFHDLRVELMRREKEVRDEPTRKEVSVPRMR